MVEFEKVSKNEANAAAQKVRELERENRALRVKMSCMKLDHEDMKPVVQYDTDACKSEDEVMAEDEFSDAEIVETDTDESDDSEMDWDLYREFE